MSEHKLKPAGLIKGQGYKASQRVALRPVRMKVAQLSDRWWTRRGWIKDEKSGKWRRP
jgi:hypothetical protein